MILKSAPRLYIDHGTNRCQALIYKVVTSRKFEMFILVCIIINTVILAVNWYSQPLYVDDLLDFISYSFAMVFFSEAILKIIALGRLYFKDRGNIFDFTIVITTIITSIISLLMKIDFGASTTFIRALRISRVFKFVHLAR